MKIGKHSGKFGRSTTLSWVLSEVPWLRSLNLTEHFGFHGNLVCHALISNLDLIRAYSIKPLGKDQPITFEFCERGLSFMSTIELKDLQYFVGQGGNDDEREHLEAVLGFSISNGESYISGLASGARLTSQKASWTQPHERRDDSHGPWCLYGNLGPGF